MPVESLILLLGIIVVLIFDIINGFHDAAQSLKLYRRAELQKDSDGSSIIEELYVDPLPNDHNFHIMMKANPILLELYPNLI